MKPHQIGLTVRQIRRTTTSLVVTCQDQLVQMGTVFMDMATRHGQILDMHTVVRGTFGSPGDAVALRVGDDFRHTGCCTTRLSANLGSSQNAAG